MTKPRKKAKRRPKRPRTLSMAAYARHRGVSRKAVDKAIAEGRISKGAATKNARGHWEIDVAKADREWAANTTRESAGAAAGRRAAAVAGVDPGERRLLFDAASIPVNEAGEPLSRVEVQTIRDAIGAQREQIELAELKGELVRRKDAERAAAELAMTVNNALLAVPARLAKQLAALDDPADVEIALEEAIVQALRTLVSEAARPTANQAA
ncbi:MAG: elements of external origin [Planctomycetota bacterium]